MLKFGFIKGDESGKASWTIRQPGFTRHAKSPIGPMVNPLKKLQSPWAKLIKFGHKHREILAILGVLVLVAVGIVIVWKVPRHQVKAYRKITDSKERATLEDAFRKTLSQIVLSAFGILLLYLTWRRTRAADSTLRLTEQSHITDRYAKAIEQLGKIDDGHHNVEVRLGAIYALGRIALDSIPDHWPIMEVLTAYVRHNAPLTDKPFTPDEKPRVDIQAVLTVLGGRETGPGREDRATEGRANQQYLDLMQCRLCGAKLNGAYFQGADFEKADLRGVSFWGANLQGAALMEANLSEAELQEANLHGAFFRGTILKGANLKRADIREAIDLTDLQVTSARKAT